MRYGTLVISQRNAVRVIEMATDEGLNFYTPEMGEDLVAAFRDAARDDSVRGIVLTGRGRAFSGGAHRKALHGERGPSGLQIGEEHFIKGFAPELAALPKLTIAALNGAATGIAVTMSLNCDLRLAAPGVPLKLNFAELGVMPGLGSTWHLPRLIGTSAAKRLLLCDRTIQSEDALKLGLVDELCAPADLIPRAIALCEQAAAGKPEIVAAIKACLNECGERGLADALAREAAAAARLREKS
jgi:enoyl-CoA hydratase/carnithine racemase